MGSSRPVAEPLLAWVFEQQDLAERVRAHNKTAVLVRGCRLCGRMDTHVVYQHGRADWPRCSDGEACEKRRAWLLEGVRS